MLEKYFSPDEVAEALQVCRRTAYAIMHQMPHLNRPFRVSETSLRRWMAERTVDPAEQAPAAKKPARLTRKQLSKLYAEAMRQDWHIPRRRA